jgi:hypothetical protein
MIRLVSLIAIALASAGCGEKNPLFCQGHSTDPRCDGDGGVVGPPCDDNHPCASGACKTPPGVCVGCLTNGDCTTNVLAPTCNMTTNTCGKCTQHSDCDSQACLSTGACAAEADVAYVEAGSPATNADCTRVAACDTLNKAVATDRKFIKFRATGTVTDSALSVIDGKTVTILADPGAKLSRSTAGPILSVTNDNADVTIVDLEITGGLGVTGDAVNLSGGTGTTAAKLTLEHVAIVVNGGFGVFSSSGGKLTMRQCMVSRNNAGGANVQNINIEMTNNMFVVNGDGAAQTGGLTLAPKVNSVFQFNTVANNISSTGTALTRGINCVVGFPADSNIVTGNTLGPTCTFNSSLFDVVVAGSMNRMGDPMFKNTDTSNPTGPDYFRIMTGSMAIDGAAASAPEMVDIDGDARPQGSAKDIGADELK